MFSEHSHDVDQTTVTLLEVFSIACDAEHCSVSHAIENTSNSVKLSAMRFIEDVAKICLTAEKSMTLCIFRSRFPLLISSLFMKKDSVVRFLQSVLNLS